MTSLWELPRSAIIAGKEYAINADYRDVIEIMGYLEDSSETEEVRWRIAVALFYEERPPEEHLEEAMKFLAWFIAPGEQEENPGPKLMDWEQDSQIIIADVNKVAGQEIRAVEFLHWWTFLAYFHAIGEGQLSTLVAVRNKLSQGKALEKWEQEYYRSNPARVNLRNKYTASDQEIMEQLDRLLGGRNE